MPRARHPARCVTCIYPLLQQVSEIDVIIIVLDYFKDAKCLPYDYIANKEYSHDLTKSSYENLKTGWHLNGIHVAL